MLQIMWIPLLKKIVLIAFVAAVVIAGGILIAWKLLKKPEEKQPPVQIPEKDDHSERTEPEPKKQDRDNQETGLTAQQLLHRVLKEKTELERYACYAKLFSQFAKPLQILMGLDAALAADTENEWLDQETVLDMLQEDVAYEMRGSLRRAGGRVEHGKIWLPLPEPEDMAFLEERIDHMPPAELESSIQKLRLEIEEMQVYKQRKELVESLTCVYEKLLKLAQGDTCPKEQLHKLTEETDRILRDNGVFAMYYEDPQLTSALAGRFGSVSEQQLVYPGLFIRTEMGYRQLGSYAGTRRKA